MTVEFISVGTEILLGNIVNTNAAYLSEKCAGLGLSCYHQSVVGDNEKRLEDALRLALSRSDIVILGGGLGPTKDDLTKQKYLGKNCTKMHVQEPESKIILHGYTTAILQQITGNRQWFRKTRLLLIMTMERLPD